MSTSTRTVNDAIVEAFTAKAERQFEIEKGTGGEVPPMRRGAHPKHHGLVRARFSIHDNLAPHLRVGLFATAATFEAYVRFSNSGREAEDLAPDAHGMAIKLLRVPGRGILEDESSTHDFILVDSPVFIARSPEAFAEFLFLNGKVAAAAATERPALLRDIGTKFPNLGKLKKTIPSPLTVTYWSQVPFALGEHAAVKYKCMPRELDGTAPTASQDKNYLRAAMVQRLADGNPVVFDFMVQVGTTNMLMLIDDPTIEWSELESPPVPVATLEIEPQTFDGEAQMNFAENISFNPAHATPEHRPLGRINFARAEIYPRMQAQRHTVNGVTPKEPTGQDF